MNRCVAVGVCALLGAAPLACADVVFALNLEFSGGTAPSGTAPWMTGTFAQNGANSVRLTVSNSFLAQEVVTGLYFNITTPNLPTAVGVSYNSGLSSAGTTPDSILRKAANPLADATFKADGDGYFDFRIDWDNNIFNGNETVVFDLTAPGLLESFFNTDSEPGGGHGSYHMAAHVQQTGGGGSSGWIGDGGEPPVVPVPSAVWLGGIGLAGVAGGRFLRTRKS